jgi:hypothetical protein
MATSHLKVEIIYLAIYVYLMANLNSFNKNGGHFNVRMTVQYLGGQYIGDTFQYGKTAFLGDIKLLGVVRLMVYRATTLH